MSYVLGMDLGTSGLKGILIDQTGQMVASAESDYPLLTPKRGHSEQDPEEWYLAAINVLQSIGKAVPDMNQKLEGISFSGQMHTLVLLDQEDKVLRNAILWNDVRTTAQCELITDILKGNLLEITKDKALEGFTLPKLLWVKEYEPEIYKKIKTFLLPKDYLGFRLTGNKQMEFSDAAGTLLLDIENRAWSESILDTFSIDPNICPKLVSSDACIGFLDPEISRNLGIEKPVKIFSGGADNACAALGAGIVAPDQAMASIGTSGVFLSNETRGDKSYNGELHYFNHVISQQFYTMGVTLAAGNSLSWFKKTFAEHESFETLLKSIDRIEPGSNGLLFTPYISGERTPYTDSMIRGSFIGMDIGHTRDHFTRAVLEGITFSLKDSYEIMRTHAAYPFKTVVSVGGGAKNKVWLQMQADIFNTPIRTLETEQGPAMGSAMIAAVGTGWFDDFKTCADAFVHYKDSYYPIEENVQKYEKLYTVYRQIYANTKVLNQQLSEWNK